MIVGSFSPVPNFGTWHGGLEVTDITDNSLIDLSEVDEITISLRRPGSHYSELALRLTNEQVACPAPGMVVWEASHGQMSNLRPSVYEVRIVIEEDGDVCAFALGSLSVVGS